MVTKPWYVKKPDSLFVICFVHQKDHHTLQENPSYILSEAPIIWYIIGTHPRCSKLPPRPLHPNGTREVVVRSSVPKNVVVQDQLRGFTSTHGDGGCD
jgi:hypothetical protein